MEKVKQDISKPRKPKRLKRALVRKRLKAVRAKVPPLNGWTMICIECVLADVAQSIGHGVDKRMLRMLCCINELNAVKGFAYVRELAVLMGMDTKTVQRLLSSMEDVNLVLRLPGKRRVDAVKSEVTGWTMTLYALGVISDIKASYASLTLDLQCGFDVAQRKINQSR